MNRKLFPLSALALACAHALAGPLPTGGVVREGSGSFSTSGSTLTVQQTSSRLVTDWQTFDIGAGQTVRFVQPGAGSVALNRVVGGDPSQILGHLESNGAVYIQNAAGVLFAPGAQVDVGSLVATSLNVDLARFDAGQLSLSGADDAGAVANHGRITTAAGGSVLLAAPSVANAGTIAAPGGSVALAAATTVAVDPSGSGLLQVAVSASAARADLVNTGAISADGGAIALQAAARQAVMRVDGTLRAHRVEDHGGTIVLAAGDGGATTVTGTLDASGEAGSHGGSVQVLGGQVALAPGAVVDASGDAGGGSVQVGGGMHGDGPLPHAATTTVAPGARIDASAGSRGDGGQVVVWSDQQTVFAGAIAARGGRAGGDGGQVEVSSRRQLDFDGSAGVDTTAPAGARGRLLLDPQNLDIGTDADVDGTPGHDLPGNTLPYDGGAATSHITAAQVAQLLATTDVTLQATNEIDVSAPLTVAPGGAASTLQLNAPIVSLDAPMTMNNAALVVDTQSLQSDAIFVNAPVTSLASIALTSTSITLSSDLAAPAVTLAGPAATHESQIIQESGGITAHQLTVDAADGLVSLAGDGNRVDQLDITAADAWVEVDNQGAPVAVRGAVGGDFSLQVDGALTQSGALTVGGQFQLTTGGDATLADAGNDFTEVIYDVGGRLTLHDANALRASGSSAGDALLTAGGVFSAGGDLATTGAASTLEVDSAGFDDSAGGRLLVQPGGRFLIRSSDYTHDDLGPLQFSASGLGDINFTVLSTWSGAEPASGNGYFTNRMGAIDAPNADRPGISRTYDGTTAFGYTQTGTAAQAEFADGGAGMALGRYTVVSQGNFDDRNAGTNKGYTVAGTNDVVAQVAGNGSMIYGLHYHSFTRAPGPVDADGPGNPLSEVLPKPVTSTGVQAVDRAYDGTTTVALDTQGATLSGVVAGDDVHVVGGTGTVADKNVGNGKPVTASPVLGGTDAGNYVVTDASGATVDITPRVVTETGVTAVDRTANGSTSVGLRTGAASLQGVLPGDDVHLDTGAATASTNSPVAGDAKPVTISGLSLDGSDAGDYVLRTPPLTVDFASPLDPLRNHQYLQAVADAQEPFRRQMLELFLAGFSKENIRKPLRSGVMFETGLAAPAIDDIDVARPAQCGPEAAACPPRREQP
jgi:filamentous hemagglutinin family protein